MSPSLSENPVLQNPRKHLGPKQREALLAVDFFRHQKRLPSGAYQIGTKKFMHATLRQLEAMALLRRSQNGLEPTMAGAIVVAKLKGETP